MELTITRKSFKAQAQTQLAALRARNLELKLSDIQESLAQAYGYANLATLYARLKKDEFSMVDAKPLRAQLENQFVVIWVSNPDDPTYGDDVLAILPPGTELGGFSGRHNSYDQVEALRETAVIVPDELDFSDESVALTNLAWVPRIDRHGLPDSANEPTVDGWVRDWLGFRVPTTGVEVHTYDTGDDSCGRDHFLVWFNNEDSAKARALFSK